MNRLEKIKKFKENKEKEEMHEKEVKDKNLEILIGKVKELRPRISELIETANACLENDIEIDAYGKTFWRSVDAYEKGSFMTNSITHKVGFVRTWGCAQRNPVKKIYEMGINAGGACGRFNFRTDGNSVYSVDEDDATRIEAPLEDALIEFLKNFDLFESEFYKYVDSLVESK